MKITKSDVPHGGLSSYFRLSEENHHLLETHSQSVQLAKQAIPIHKGDKISGAYVVTAGCLRVFSYTPDGNQSTFYLIRPGETCVFAINCLFNKLLYPAWVIAEEETEVSVIPGPVFRQLFEKEPAIQSLTIDALSTAVQKLMFEVEQLHGWNLTQRLANMLLNRANDYGLVYMTQQEIASRLGTTREVVARILREMSASGLIATRRGEISLINTANMATLIAV